MNNWKVAEEQGYLWFKENIDPNAEACGGEDSTVGDIYSPLYDSYIEVKDITVGARCGQFTESTIKNNPFAQAIYDGNDDPKICREFVKYHYSKKNISHFIVINGKDLALYPYDDFFVKFNFEIQKPYEKRSGTRQAPKKDIPVLIAMDSEFILGQDSKVYCNNPNRWGDYFSMTDPFDYFISKNNQGELRKRSSTKNLTWHLLIK
ncbi:MAG: hypothetical protein PUJ51_03630 [Clostridiales bacterium]|nr:hypothetical protein [Clostridiales bacterium]